MLSLPDETKHRECAGWTKTVRQQVDLQHCTAEGGWITKNALSADSTTLLYAAASATLLHLPSCLKGKPSRADVLFHIWTTPFIHHCPPLVKPPLKTHTNSQISSWERSLSALPGTGKPTLTLVKTGLKTTPTVVWVTHRKGAFLQTRRLRSEWNTQQWGAPMRCLWRGFSVWQGWAPEIKLVAIHCNLHATSHSTVHATKQDAEAQPSCKRRSALTWPQVTPSMCRRDRFTHLLWTCQAVERRQL